ncbi:siderophore ABC transporter substrate-binding protein [Mariniluteicoccus flavus]
MLRMLTVLVAAALTLVLAACGGTNKPAGENQAAALTVTHAQGTTKIEKTPKRIAVLDFGALDTVKALGLSDRVVALPKQAMPSFLSEFADDKYANLGTLAEPNYEALNKANPDLVIVGFRSAKTYPEMSKHWPTLDITFGSDKDLISGTEHAAKIIAQGFGPEVVAEADKQVAALKTQADKVKATGASAGKGLVLMTSGGKVTMHGPKSRYGAIHTLFGVQTAKSDIKEDAHGEPVSFELVAKTNPDTLFVVDRDAAIGTQGQNAMAILDNELVRGTTAWKNNKVVQLDGKRWYITIHGLANAGAMIDEVAKGLSK